MKYWTCPYCGANLDSGEKCDCQQGSKNSEVSIGQKKNKEEKEIADN